MGSLYTIYAAIFGAIVGSFLNVVIHRLPLDQSVVRPRSRCPHCKTPIKAGENIPIVSYFLLKGKCSTCKTKISWQYPAVELVTALAFAASFYRANGTLDMTLFREWVFIAAGIAISIIDIHHRIIPDELSLGGWVFALATCAWDRNLAWPELLGASFIGFAVFMGFAMAYEKITGRVGLGGGDIKLMGPLGAFLGFGGLWATILMSSILGVVAGLITSRFEDNKEGVMKTTIPYGPFLILGAFCEYFLGVSTWLNMNLFQ